MPGPKLFTGYSINWDTKHIRQSELYARKVHQVYLSAIREASRIGKSIKKFNPDKPFSFSDYPQTRQRVNDLFAGFHDNIQSTILNGMSQEWLLANQKNDDLINQIFDKSGIPKSQLSEYYRHNLEALSSFQKRKTGGLGLSDRVWKYTHQFKSEIELGLDVGLGEGKPATGLAKDMKGYLQNPDKLFRRVRDKRGQLQLSKAAKAFHPGQGIYRSSYKNALRLTRTETNMAYRQADNERWSQMEFVLGIEVRTSHSHKVEDICDDLAGRYPKDFKFTGWHPICRCNAVPILAGDEDFSAMQDAILNGDDPGGVKVSGAITDVPSGFKKWVKNNKDKIERAKSKPYFIRDNKKFLKGSAKMTQTPKSTMHIPALLADYEKAGNIKVDPSIFSMLSKPIEMKITKRGGAFYDPEANKVTISITDRRLKSSWNAESVIYHEYGHAIDFQHNIRNMPEIADLMAKYRNKYAANGNKGYKEIDKVLWNNGESAYQSGDHNKLNKTGAAHDTLMALNPKFGAGHPKSYWKQIPEADKLEFVAHMFENKFIGNDIFKKYMPDLYDDMIKTFDKVSAKLK